MQVCGEAADGLEAVDAAAQQRPDLILMDIAMPKLNGPAAIFKIRQTLPFARIVLLSLYSSDLVKEDMATNLRADLVLDKSVPPSQLMGSLKALMASQNDSMPPATSAGAQSGGTVSS
jgi:DNA-binding NarL/FixJ family response regulator